MADLLASVQSLISSILAEPSDLQKAGMGSAVTKPKGPPGSKKDYTDQKPGSAAGLPAPDNKPGPGRGHKDGSTAASSDVKTTPRSSAGGAAQEFLYLSKKDFPQAPKGTVDSTPNSWKVPAGLGRQLAAKVGEGTEETPTSEAEATKFSSQKHSRDTKIAHLKAGKIASQERTTGDNISDTFKIVIQGNGAGLMKPSPTKYNVPVILASKEKPDEPGYTFDGEDELWKKQVTKEVDPTAPETIGAGSGNLTYGKAPQREVAGHQVAQLHGMDNVPITVERSENGVVNSVQSWVEDFTNIATVKKVADPYGKAFREIEVFRSLVAREKRDEVDQQLMDIAIHDIVINNNDRHGNNFGVDKNTAKVTLIDHGNAFGNSMHGNRNHFLHNVFHRGQPIVMSDTLKTRMKNLSYNDYKRAKPGMSDWESGQDFLRNRYTVWLQENHGSIDRQKFLHTESSNDGKHHGPGDPSNWGFAGSREKQIDEFQAREAAGVLPHQLFESWSKAFLDQAANDPSHRDHADAKSLTNLGVFMERGFCSFPGGEAAYRAAGLHKKYEASITGSFDIPKSIPSYMESSGKSVEHQQAATTFNSVEPEAEEKPIITEEDNPAMGTAPAKNKNKKKRTV